MAKQNYEHKNNSGSLFKNDRKEGDPNKPDYTGQGKIGDQDYWLSLWVKTSDKGTKFLSFSATPKDEQSSGKRPSKPKQEAEDGVPF